MNINARAGVFVELTTHGALTVNDTSALDLSRGEACICKPFESQDALLGHLAINLLGEKVRLSRMDGWADLRDDAVIAREFDMEVELS